MRKKIFNYVVLAIIIVLSLKVLIGGLDEKTVVETLERSDWHFLVIGLMCMFGYWGLEAVMMDRLIKKVSPKIHFWAAIKSTIIGQYYSFLTPFASGGQPMQLYYLGKDNVPVGSATAVLVSKFLLFQITVTLYSMGLFFFRLQDVIVSGSPAMSFVILGLTINTIGLTAIVLMAFKPHVFRIIGHIIVKVLHLLHLIKDEEKAFEKLEHSTREYHDAMLVFQGDLWNTLRLFFLSILQLTFFFSVTYCVYLALGLRGISYLEIISLQAMLYMAVSFIPVPGTAGASEVGFSILLGSVFTSNVLAMAILLWRGISYYFGLVFCGLFTLLIHFLDKKKESRQTS